MSVQLSSAADPCNPGESTASPTRDRCSLCSSLEKTSCPFEKSRPRPRRSGIESEEERAWVGFYQRVGRDPAIATEVMAQLESDPEMKRTHLAL